MIEVILFLSIILGVNLTWYLYVQDVRSEFNMLLKRNDVLWELGLIERSVYIDTLIEPINTIKKKWHTNAIDELDCYLMERLK